MRPVVLSHLSWEASRMNHPLRIYSYPQPGCVMPDRSTCWSNTINPTKSPIQLIWTALIFSRPFRTRAEFFRSLCDGD